MHRLPVSMPAHLIIPYQVILPARKRQDRKKAAANVSLRLLPWDGCMKKNPPKGEKNLAASYNTPKKFEGKRYTGMKVGRTHHWYYDQGDWKEKKVTPEKWELTYSTTKRRA